MGIPTFFRKIINQYPNIHHWNEKESFTHLFIDFNCLIYQAYRHLGEFKSESLLIKAVVEYLEKLVNTIVRPSELVYIAFDGVVPRSKMVEQRKRRYKSLKIDEYKAALQKKYNVPPSGSWDPSINILPGTAFMKNLSIAIWASINKGRLKAKEVILSDASVSGEGEQKFISYIRNLDGKSKICIYGLDADLIVLSLTTHKKDDILILREAQDSPIEVEKYGQIGYLYLSPIKYIHALFDSLRIDTAKYDIQRVIYDYTFLTFLAGNDFVRRISFIKITEKPEGGFDLLLSIYKRLLTEFKTYLIDNDTLKVNYLFFSKIIKELAEKEEHYLREMNKGRHGKIAAEQQRFKDKAAELGNAGGGANKVAFELEKFEHSSYYNPINPYYKKYEHYFKKIDYNQSREIWRKQYYQEFFNTNEPEYITMICEIYLQSLLYTLRYYLESESPDLHWYYPFNTAPLISDLHQYLASKKDLNHIKFKKTDSYTPLQQLMLILPVQKANKMLPKKYVQLMQTTLLPYYPIDFNLDVIQGEKFMRSEPILPNIEDEVVMKELKKIKLSVEEKTLNKLDTTPKEWKKM